MEFTVIPFDEENDPTKPVVGSMIEAEGKEYIVHKVKAMTLAEIMKLPEEDQPKVFIKDHPDRPLIYWVCWISN